MGDMETQEGVHVEGGYYHDEGKWKAKLFVLTRFDPIAFTVDGKYVATTKPRKKASRINLPSSAIFK